MGEGRLLHAYGIQGKWDEVRAEIDALSRAFFNMPLGVHPDTLCEFYELFGIDESRALLERGLRLPQEKRNLLVIGYGRITVEAQNALLKLFEDPPQATHFFLVTPRHVELLPTLRSRLFLITADSAAAKDTSAASFVRATPSQRLELVRALLEEKNPEAISLLVDGIESWVYREGRDTARQRDALNELLIARKYLRDRGASAKILLEHLSIVL